MYSFSIRTSKFFLISAVEGSKRLLSCSLASVYKAECGRVFLAFMMRTKTACMIALLSSMTSSINEPVRSTFLCRKEASLGSFSFVLLFEYLSLMVIIVFSEMFRAANRFSVSATLSGLAAASAASLDLVVSSPCASIGPALASSPSFASFACSDSFVLSTFDLTKDANTGKTSFTAMPVLWDISSIPAETVSLKHRSTASWLMLTCNSKVLEKFARRSALLSCIFHVSLRPRYLDS
mmetsp:Transcript_20106/g.31448  ORF Transcript_20106/g.31448 Transcript_20106/m.31448 type:complete len:237 (+) Transcript_20106:130-840(+)